MYIRKNIITFALVLSLIFAAAGLSAWEIDQATGANFAYYVDSNKGGTPGSAGFQVPSYVPKKADDSDAWKNGPYGVYTADPNYSWTSADPETRDLGSGWGSVELEGFYRFRAKTPFLVGDGMLFKDNNVTFIVKPVLAPVSLHLETEVHWQPIAFLKLQAGISMGTGWYLAPLNVHGLALNNQDDITDTPSGGFAGLYYLGGTFQFDFEALFPGEWNHVVISATAKARYLNYNKAGPTDSWIWRGDGGQNFNGWQYKGDYALGWQPPWKVNFIGIIAEHFFYLSSDVKNSSTVDNGGWGSDFHVWRFGPAVNVDLSKGHGLTILLQFQNGLYYTEATAYARWFDKWSATGDVYVKLDRLALAYTYKF